MRLPTCALRLKPCPEEPRSCRHVPPAAEKLKTLPSKPCSEWSEDAALNAIA